MRRGYADNQWNLSCFNHPWASGQIRESCNYSVAGDERYSLKLSLLLGKEVILWCFLRCIPKKCFLEESSPMNQLPVHAPLHCQKVPGCWFHSSPAIASESLVAPRSNFCQTISRHSPGGDESFISQGFHPQYPDMCKRENDYPNLCSHLLPTKKLAIYHWTCVSRRRHCLDAR